MFFLGSIEVHFTESVLTHILVKAESKNTAWVILREHAQDRTTEDAHFQAKGLTPITDEQAEVFAQVALLDTIPRQPQPWDDEVMD